MALQNMGRVDYINVYVICNSALVHKQYVIANSTERVPSGFFTVNKSLKDRLNTGYLITGLYYDTCRLADSWVYNCYYYFLVYVYIGFVVITKGKHEK